MYTFLILIILSAPNILFSSNIHTVKENETLMLISKKYYGTHRCWDKIFEKNRDVLKNINSLEIGIKLDIPSRIQCPIKAVFPIEIQHSSSIKKTVYIPSTVSKTKKITKTYHPNSKFIIYKSNKKKVMELPETKDKTIIGHDIITPNNNKFIKAGPKKIHTIQIGAYRTIQEAMYIKEKMIIASFKPYIQKFKDRDGTRWYRVRVGSFNSVTLAKKFIKKRRVKAFSNDLFITTR